MQEGDRPCTGLKERSNSFSHQGTKCNSEPGVFICEVSQPGYPLAAALFSKLILSGSILCEWK